MTCQANPYASQETRIHLSDVMRMGCLLLVSVLAVFSILAGFALRWRRDGVMDEFRWRVAELQPIVDAIESFRDEHGEYPDSLGGLEIDIPHRELHLSHSTLLYARDCEGLSYLLVWNQIGNRLEQAGLSFELVYTPGDPNNLTKENLFLERSFGDGWTIWATVDGEPLYDGFADCLEEAK